VLPGHPKPEIATGRIVTLEFDSFWLVGTYAVNAGDKLKTLEEKKEWNLYLERHLRDLDSRSDKGVVWTGDLNVAATDLDLSNAKKNWNKTAGYTEEETTWFRNLLNPPEPVASSKQENPPEVDTDAEEGDVVPAAQKFIDVWRIRHPKERKYSYFSYRFNCREKGLGWRLDMCEYHRSQLRRYITDSGDCQLY
jgi:AP endonuclease-1